MSQQTSNHQKRPQKTKRAFDNYIKYSSIALQMMVIITAGVLGGFKLDQYVNIGFPLFTLLFAMIAIAIAIYLAIKDFIKQDKKK